MCRSFERLKQTAAQTVYRSRQPLQPCTDDNTLPVLEESILDALKEVSALALLWSSVIYIYLATPDEADVPGLP